MIIIKKKDIQVEIDTIQKRKETPDFMLVTAYSDYELESDGLFREADTGEAFFNVDPTLSKKDVTIKLAEAIIQQSL